MKLYFWNSSTATLALFFLALLSIFAKDAAAQVAKPTLAWDQPRDGSGNLLSNFTGYRIYYRTASGTFNTSGTCSAATNCRQVSGNPATTTYTFTDLTPGTYYFTVRSYVASPAAESVNSNEAGIHSLRPQLDADANFINTTAPNVVRQFNVNLYNPGVTTAFSKLSLNSSDSGVISLPITAGIPAVVDLWVKTPGYLGKRFNSYTLTSASLLTALVSGDTTTDPLNASYNRVNLLDGSGINANWGTSAPQADFDDNGTVNLLDAAKINAHWNQVGDVPGP